MKKTKTNVRRTDRLADFVEALIEQTLSVSLRSDLVLHPLTLHEAVTHCDEAAKLLRPSGAAILRHVRELLADQAGKWDAEAGGPPPRPVWMDAASESRTTVTDADVLEASRRLGI